MINPATSLTYMLAGYAVILSAMGVYLFSLWLRYRSLQRELAMLEELEAQNSTSKRASPTEAI